MPDTIVDSCVVAKWVLAEPDSPQAERILADAAASGDRLIVLDLAFPEVANAIWKRYHRSILALEEARACLGALLRTPVHVEPSRPLLVAALEIAARYGRSIYDAAFVALAQHLALKGVTADEPLYNAVHADFTQIVRLRDW
jgi:predicted nucleic acid-binding protein